MKLSTILKDYEINIKNTKIIRHPYNKPDVKEIYDKGFIEAYQSEQGSSVFDGCEYILSFLGVNGTSAIFLGYYKVGSKYEGNEKLEKMPVGFPYPEMFKHGVYYDLIKQDKMSDLENRLVIDWGKATRCWHQWANNDKEVIAIYTPKNMRKVKGFVNYEETILSYDELKVIIEDPITYEDWYLALSNINAIYLILDTATGKQYVGSTYGQDGVWGRWKCYVETITGGDVGIQAELDNRQDAFKHFQYTILRVLPKTITMDEAINIENLYKTKFGSRKFGMNNN